MAPGTRVEVKKEWRHVYRRPGAALTGVLVSQSPSREVSRIRLDGVADSYLCTDHLDVVSVPAEAGDWNPSVLALRPSAEIQPVPA